MHEKQVSNIQQYLTEVELWSTHTRIYRGVPNKEFKLVPSLGRVEVVDIAGTRPIPGASLEERREQYEKKLLEEFKRRALPFLTVTPRYELEWLCLAQHYGVPTRLLDWTTNPLVALFFACDSLPDEWGAVYIRYQTKWLSAPHEVKPFKTPDEIWGIQPDHSDKRFVNQEGVFTVQPDYRVAIEDGGKLVFDPKAKDHMKWQLAKFGIRASVIFPGLDGVAKDVTAVCETARTGTVREADPYRSLRTWGR